MDVRSFWTLFFITIALTAPGAYCRSDYAQYYISKYHKVSTSESTSSETPVSTAESISSRRLGSTLTVATSKSGSEGSTSDEKNSPAEGTQITGLHESGTVLQQGDRYYDDYDIYNQSRFVVRVVLIVGGIVAFILVLGCIVCCCKGCRGKTQSGFIMGNNAATGAYPQQPLIAQPPSQEAVPVQHFPPNYSTPLQQPPPVQQPYVPPYPQPGQQQDPRWPTHQPNSQYPSNEALQFYNPPEAPPPYDDFQTQKH